MSGCFTAESVAKYYGRTRALEDVTVEFCRGLNVLIGPNGSGKTTLLRLFTGLARPTRGRVESLGLDPWRHRTRLLNRIGVGFEGMRLPWWLTGEEVLRLYARTRGIPWSRILEVAESLGVTEYVRRSIRSYSMGMRKKILLAIALAGDPEALILDEPYTLLDSATILVLDSILLREAREKPVIVASHVRTEALEQADRMLLLVNGRPAAIREKTIPALAYTCRVVREKAFAIASKGADKLKRMELKDDRVILVYKEPVEMPSEGCSPIIVMDYELGG